MGVEIINRGNRFRVVGEERAVRVTGQVIRSLYDCTRTEELSPQQVYLSIKENSEERPVNDNAERKAGREGNLPDAALGEEAGGGKASEGRETDEPVIELRSQTGVVRGRSANQRRYLRNIQTHDLSFGIGLAGTGKTYLAVACAVAALGHARVRRIVLVRPAVEAGERLGFLPGDMSQKVQPYLQPLYDALYEMIGFERVERYQEQGVIEVAPLAFMRGRTLNEAFVILDEAQNTTIEQMKMFLTRAGFGSTTVVTGDVTQIDLPAGRRSGLMHAIDVLGKVPGISFTWFDSVDVVRHPLVSRILDAYEREVRREENGET